MRCNFTRVLYISLVAFLSNGCSSNDVSCTQKEGQIFKSTYRERSNVLPQLPVSAEERLLKALDAYSIINIDELVYMSGQYSFLGVSGAFAVRWGSVFHYSYVLRKAKTEFSWENAKIYKWRPALITYEDNSGEIINVGISSVSSLATLPENILTNYLSEITNVPEESVWTTDEYDDWCRRMGKVTINPEKIIAPPRGAEGNSGSEEI